MEKRELIKNVLRGFMERLKEYGINMPKQSRIIEEILDRFAPLQWCRYCREQKQHCRCEFSYYVARSNLGKDCIIFCARCGLNEENHTCGEEDALVLKEVYTSEQVQA